MRIIIAGCGIVGTALAARFAAEKHNVTVIDIIDSNVNYVQNNYDVLGICGDASTPDVLEEADVRSANLFIAVTDSDEENLLACLLARKLGARNTIARVRSSANTKTATLLNNEMGLSMVINPEMDAAREIFNALKYKPVGQIESLAKGTTDIITCTVKPDGLICGVPLREVGKVTGVRVLICGIKRDDEVFIPSADTVIQAGDTLSFAATTRNALLFFKKLKFDMEKIRKIVIIGGSKLGVFLARMVVEAGIPVTMIDNGKERCKDLLNLVPEAEIICGDGTDTDLLEEEGVLESSVVVAATEDDSTNTMIGLYFSKVAPDIKMIVKIKKSDFEDMIYSLNIGSIYNPKYITIERVDRYVRAMQDSLQDEIESSCRVIDGKVLILEFNILDGMPHLGRPLSEVRFKKDLLVATIYRSGRAFIPGASDTIEAGDIVIIATTNENIKRFADIFA